MSEDPLGFAGGLNRYTYAGNDPINWLDYRGTARELPGWGKGVVGGLTIIGGIVGGLGGGGIGGGLGFVGGLVGGPVAIVTAGGGAAVGVGVGSTAGAGAGAALGFAVVTLFDNVSDLFQQASNSGGRGPVDRDTQALLDIAKDYSRLPTRRPSQP